MRQYSHNSSLYVPKEYSEQKAVFQWAKLRENEHPELKGLFHCPNGGARDEKTGALMKAIGTKPGVCDLLLLVSRGTYHGLAIELKRQKGGTLTQNQKKWINRLNRNGYCAVVCYGAKEAIAKIEWYLKLGDYHKPNAEEIAGVMTGICNDETEGD